MCMAGLSACGNLSKVDEFGKVEVYVVGSPKSEDLHIKQAGKQEPSVL